MTASNRAMGNSPAITPPLPRFERGIFTLSLDFELIWGTLDLQSHHRFVSLCTIEREQVVSRLLDLFAEFKVSATWCTVGHLFLDRCVGGCGRRHPELVRSSAWDAIRLNRDPGTSEEHAPVFYGRKLVDQIRDCETPQEIGSHSFSHVLFDESACSLETAESELEAAVSAADELGLELRSFAFPRNRIGHTGLLRKYGFTSYRNRDQSWYEPVAPRRWFHRAAHLADILIAGAPPAVLPHWDPNGLWAIPGSMLYTPAYGLRKCIPVQLRVARARKGLRAAVRERRIFHLWLHPTDLAERTDAMLSGLRRIFETVAQLRDAGEIEVLTMGELAHRLSCLTALDSTTVPREVA